MRAPRERIETARIATCAQCGCLSGLRWAGWRALRTDENEQETPAIAFFCPTCAEREFGFRVR